MVNIPRHATLGALLLLVTGGAPAADWTLRLEPNFVDAYGNDQHVLTIHQRDSGATPTTDRKTAVDLELARALNYGLGLRRMEGLSGWGMDIFWYGVTNESISRQGAGGGTVEVAFDASDQSYSSTDPGTVLYYITREDNRLEVWTADFYYIRNLSAGAGTALELQLGWRFGDFDNDYRAGVGIEGVEGHFIDGSSNYPRMMGPLVGFNGRFEHGRSRIEGYIGQSLIVGRAELQSSQRHFTGAFSEQPEPVFDDEASFHDWLQVAVPITELRLRYSFQLTESLSLGTGASTSAWWDVSVPPSAIPGPNAGATLHENTVVFYSILASVEWKF